MGAWEPKPFDNDEGLDFLAEYKESKDVAILGGALRSILISNGPDADLEARAVAAAEIVAALSGHPPRWITAEMRESIAFGTVPESFKSLAERVIIQIRKDSELRTLWEESGPEKWFSAMDDLLDRLGE